MIDLQDRHLEPEILDGLAADDPAAVASRRDLVRINALMFQARIMRSLLQAHVPTPPRRILEIGSGDGKFMLAVARRMAGRWPNVAVTMVDRIDLIQGATRDAFAKLGWEVRPVIADIFDPHEKALCADYDLVCVNLVLHHFDEAQLCTLFARLRAAAPVLVATEPLRARGPLIATRCLRLIGANAVTLNDAAQSVRAGFRGSELSQLWRSCRGEAVFEGRKGLFTQGFVGARRLAGP